MDSSRADSGRELLVVPQEVGEVVQFLGVENTSLRETLSFFSAENDLTRSLP
jgi:hypothetical protein